MVFKLIEFRGKDCIKTGVNVKDLVMLDTQAIISNNFFSTKIKRKMYAKDTYVSFAIVAVLSTAKYIGIFRYHTDVLLNIANHLVHVRDRKFYEICSNLEVNKVPLVFDQNGKIIGMLVLIED